MKKTNKNKNVKVTVKTKPNALGYAGALLLGGAVVGSTVRNVKDGIDIVKSIIKKFDDKKKNKYLDEELEEEDDFFDDMKFDDYDEEKDQEEK